MWSGVTSGGIMRAPVIPRPVIHEVPRQKAAAHAVAIWAELPRAAREQTLPITSGRRLLARQSGVCRRG
jgi:hypothetical protein